MPVSQLSAGRSRPKPGLGLPSWLISAVVHLVLLILLTLTFVDIPRGARSGMPLLASLAAPREDEGAAAATVAMLSPSTAEAWQNATRAAMSDTAAPTNLASALNGATSLDPSDALPSEVAPLGGDAVEGGAVASAAGAASSRAGRGTGNLGGKAYTSVFGAEAEGYKFVYVFDRSASMGGSGRNALGAAKAELLASLGDLKPTHQFQVIFYNDRLAQFDPAGDGRMIFATDQNKNLAGQFIGLITADGGTRHEVALSTAIRMQPDVIFFLTDADEPKLGPGQLEAIHRMANGITINTIEFGFGPQMDSNNFLVRLARQNGGQHVYVDVSKIVPLAARAQ